MRTHLLSCLAVLASALTLNAADRYWTNSAGGTYQTALNWSPNLVPGAADNAFFTNNSSYTVNLTSGVNNSSTFFNAPGGVVTLGASGNSWTLTNSLLLGQNAGSFPQLTQDGSSVLVTNAAVTGTLDVRRGTLRINNGLLQADRLQATNIAGQLDFRGGTLVTRGGTISNSSPFTVGSGGSVPAVWDVRAGTSMVISNSVHVGAGTPGSRLFLTNGGSLFTTSGYIGNATNGNSALLSGIGSSWLASGFLVVGGNSGGSLNHLVISNSARLTNNIMYVGDSANTFSNLLLVTGPNTFWHNSNITYIGLSGAFNQFVLTNGARAFNGSGASIGQNPSATNNRATVTGPGTVWSNSVILTVGLGAAGNALFVNDSGLVVTPSFLMGNVTASTNNRVVLESLGTVQVTNSTGTAVYEVRRGTNVLDGGQILADTLRVTNSASFFDFHGGTLNVRTGLVANGREFLIGNGSSSAQLRLTSQGRLSFADGAVITNNASLVGHGTISGSLTVQGLLTPDAGSATGRLVLSNSPALQGTLGVEISKNGSALTNDVLQVTDSLTLGGTLFVTNLGPDSLALGDTFTLLQGPSRSGAFTNLILPPLPVGWAWSNRLALDGAIEVAIATVADTVWTNSAGGTFETAANWLDNFAPRPQDSATFISNASYTVTRSGSTNADVFHRAASGTVTQAGTWNVTNSFVLGPEAGQNPTVIQSGGALRATNAAGSATLEVRRGTFVISNFATVQADSLRLTNSGGQLVFPNGTLNLRSSLVNNAQTFRVGDGAALGQLNLLGNGAHTFANGLILTNLGFLNGRGTITGPVTVQAGGGISPASNPTVLILGGDPGSITTGDLLLESGANYGVDLNGTTAGTGYDQLVVNGTVTLNNPNLNLGLNFTPGTGNTFTLIANDGADPVAGTFNGLPQGGVINVGGSNFVISYIGGTGNDVVLSYLTPPFISSLSPSRTNSAGDQVTFTATATSGTPPAYQWRFNGVDIPDATNTSLILNPVDAANAGLYSVRVTNLAGSTLSSDRVLTVNGSLVDTLARWSFNSEIPDASTTTGSTNPAVSSGNLQMQGTATFTFVSGTTSDPASLGNDNSGLQTTSYAVANPNKTSGVRWNVSTAGREDIVICWEQRTSATASRYWRFRYTTNGTDFVDANVINTTVDSVFLYQKADLSAVPGVADNPNFAFEIVSEYQSTATGGGSAAYVGTSSTFGSGGTCRFDLVTVFGIEPVADHYWTNVLGGTYQVAGNWSPNRVPGATNNAHFTNAASYQVTWTNDAAAANAIFSAPSGVVTQAIGAFAWQLTNSYVIGPNAGQLPTVTHTSGTLRVVNDADTAVLEVRRGTNRIDGGVIEADRLQLTNTAGRLVFNGGTLITRGGTVNNGAGVVVGAAGSAPAAWDVRAGTDTVLSSSLTLGSAVPGSQLFITNGGRLIDLSATVGSTASSTGNQVWVAGPGSTWTNSSFMDLGISGGFNLLVVSNGGALFNQSSYLGSNAGSRSNRVVLTGPGSLWDNRTDTRVGSSGAFNELWVTDGATKVARQLTVGFNASSTNNRAVVDGGSLLVTNASGTAPFDIRRGTNELLAGYLEADRLILTNGAGAFRFDAGTLVTRGATLTSGAAFVVGDSGGTPATWDVRAGAPSTISSLLIVGNTASHARLLLTNGAALTSDGASLGSINGANSNAVVIAGPGSVWTNTALTRIGREGNANSLVVSNGGAVFNTETRLGDLVFFFASQSNVVQVTGPGSRLHNVGRLSVGEFGAANRLEITDGGEVTATNCVVGVNTAATGNRLLVDGGSLFVTNATQSGQFEIRRGTNFLTAGFIEADELRLPNSLGRFQFNSGGLSLRASLVNNTQPFIVGNGVDAATLHLAGDGLHTFNSGLSLSANALLTGNGTLNGAVTFAAGSTVAPGTSAGKIVLSTPPALGGTLLVEISKNGVTLTNDVLQLTSGMLTYGGELVVTHIGPDALVAGNSFKLFDAPGYAGSFADVTLPALDPGLTWDNKLLLDGSIEVASIPPGDRFWTNTAGGTYQVAGNWLPNAVPGLADNAVFVSNATYGVTWAADAVAANARFTADGGTVTQAIGGFTWLLTNSYLLGPDAGQLPTVHHTSGTLRVTNAAGTGVLEVRGGTNTFDAGVIEANRLLLTNSDGRFQFNGGTLITRGASIANGTTFVVGNSGGTPAIWDVRAGSDHVLSSNLNIGVGPGNCHMLITNAGRLENGFGRLGANASSTGHVAIVSGPGSTWTNRNDLTVGDLSSGNRLVVSNAGAVFCAGGRLGSSSIVRSNSVVVVGSNSVWRMTGSLVVGNTGSGNQVTVSEGGEVSSSTGSLGANSTASNNIVSVTGSGSAWTLGSSLTVGAAGSHNQLSVTDSGLVSATSLTIGSTASSTNNRVVVDSGTLRVTNAAGTAALDIRRGTNHFLGGLIEANVLRLTNELGFFALDGGTVNVRSSTVANGQTLFVGNGSSAASFNLVGNGAHSFANGLTLRSNATLTGNGSVTGTLTALLGSTVAPGTSVGKLVLSNAPALAGKLLMEISKTGVTLTNDVLQLTIGTLTYSGDLVVTNIGPDALLLGNNFKLFPAASYAGSFASVTLPALGGGLTWTNKLLVDGSVEVITAPPPYEFNLTGIAGPGLLPGNEFPPTFGGTGGEFGSGVLFDEVSGLLTVQVAWGSSFGFLDASSAVVAAHIHGPTPSNYGNGFSQTAGVLFGLTPFSATPVSGFVSQSVWPLSPAQKAELFAGRYYINVHTAVNLGGEMRGFLVPAALPPPAFGTIVKSGTDVVMSGSGGVPGGAYVVLSATNVTLPRTNWTPLVTNQFDPSGNFNFTNPVTPGERQRYFQIQIP